MILLQNFSVTQILREIKVGEYIHVHWVSKDTLKIFREINFVWNKRYFHEMFVKIAIVVSGK